MFKCSISPPPGGHLRKRRPEKEPAVEEPGAKERKAPTLDRTFVDQTPPVDRALTSMEPSIGGCLRWSREATATAVEYGGDGYGGGVWRRRRARGGGVRPMAMVV
ncbi:hypothetical protein E3N88_31382 [Mikania micrantha]|uniref:Uncharacterized protein n=1 Tax=Mikania micrantha TaxID=192012 RepID=A0A5N6MPV5_9ASTR|nr:hypothetical protein E3N88_31382 [Mikania micrantha]